MTSQSLFTAVMRRTVFGLLVCLLAAPGYSQFSQDEGGRTAGGLRHRVVSNTPGQISNLADVAAFDGRLYLVWREVLRDGRQQCRWRG